MSEKAATAAAAIFPSIATILEPQTGLEVWEWAEEHLELTPKVTPYHGPLSFERTPYMKGEWSPLWAYRRYRQCDNIWAAQTGKTLMLQVTFAYDVACDPGPGMIVYPDEHTARRRARRHIKPLAEDCLKPWLTGSAADLSSYELAFTTCTVMLGWAGSASVLAGEPVKHLKLDEEGKFKRKTDAEADAKRLALRRIIAYGEFGNAFGCTTPSLKDLPGWRDWEHSTRCEYHVPCPFCGQFQATYFNHEDRRWFVGSSASDSEWSGGVKWAKGTDLSRDDLIATAYYECAACGEHWNDRALNDAVRLGRWVPANPQAIRYASHLPSWAAPWVKLSEVVERWFDSYRDEEARHDFANSDCAVPYEPKGKTTDADKLRRHILPGLKAGTVHPDADALYLTADVHDSHIRYRVRAWASDTTTWGVEEGQLPPDLAALDAVLARSYPTAAGGRISVSYGLIDSGWRTDEVYQFCLRHYGRMWPTKGYESMKELVSYSKIHVVPDALNGVLLGGELMLVLIHDPRIKDQLFNKLDVSVGERGAWYLEEDISDAFIHQMSGERKVERKDRRGRMVSEWRQTHENHALDCEKQQIAASVVFQLTSLAKRKARPETSSAEVAINPFTKRAISR